MLLQLFIGNSLCERAKMKYICPIKKNIIIIKVKELLKNRKFRCVVYMSNELISKIIWLSFWLLVSFSVLFVNCGDNIKVYFSIVTHEIPLRVIKKTHVGLDAQSGRQ